MSGGSGKWTTSWLSRAVALSRHPPHRAVAPLAGNHRRYGGAVLGPRPERRAQAIRPSQLRTGDENGLRGPGPAACDDHCSIAPGAYADLNTYEHYVADKKWPFWSLAPQVYLTFIRRLVVT